MSYKEERQPQPASEGDEQVDIAPHKSSTNSKALYGPPTLAIVGWCLYPCSYPLGHPRWGTAPLWGTAFVFAALVLGFFVVPLLVLNFAWKWWKVPPAEKDAASSAFYGWLVAWIFLFAGFQLVPWSGAF